MGLAISDFRFPISGTMGRRSGCHAQCCGLAGAGLSAAVNPVAKSGRTIPSR